MGSGNGAWYVNGDQTALPGGNQTTLGPFAQPFSPAQDVLTQNILSAGQMALSLPTNPQANGVWIIPPSTNTTVTLLFQGTGGSDTGFFINPAAPTFINFDPNNYPGVIFITTSDAISLVTQFT